MATPTPRDFIDAFGSKTIEADQQHPARVPKRDKVSWFKSIAELFTDDFSRFGQWPVEFRPETGRVFQVPRVLVPLEDIDTICYSSSACFAEFIVEENGVKYFQFPIHPNELDANPELQRWLRSRNYGFAPPIYGTPTASNRTLFTLIPRTNDSDSAEFSPHLLKLSSAISTSGSSRFIDRGRLLRAINASKIVEDAHKDTSGILPSGMPWYIRSEVGGAIPKVLTDQGGFIRRLPAKLPPDQFSVMAASLNVEVEWDGIKEKLVDLLYRKSGYSSRNEFIYSKLVQPFWEVQMMLGFQYGVAHTSHGQNNFLVLNNDWNLAGVGIQDFSSPIDADIRAYSNRETHWIIPNWARPEDFKTESAHSEILEGLDYFIQYYFDYVIGLTVSSEDQNWMMSRLSIDLANFGEHNLGIPKDQSTSNSNFISAVRSRFATVASLRESQRPFFSLPLEAHRPQPSTRDSRAKPSPILQRLHWGIATQPLTPSTLANGKVSGQGGAHLSPVEITIGLSDQDLIAKATNQSGRALIYFIEELERGTSSWDAFIPRSTIARLLGDHGERYLSSLRTKHSSNLKPTISLPTKKSLYYRADFFRNAVTQQILFNELQIDPIPGLIHYLPILEGDPWGPKNNVYQDLTAQIRRTLNMRHDPFIVITDYHISGPGVGLLGQDPNDKNRQIMLWKTLQHLPNFGQVHRDATDALQLQLGRIPSNTIGENESRRETSLALDKRGNLIYIETHSDGTKRIRKVDYVLNYIHLPQLDQYFPEVLKASESGNVLLSTHPLGHLVGNKVIQFYLPAMIRHYLHEEPTIPFSASFVFVDQQGNLDSTKLELALGGNDNWVIKKGSGFGSNDVHFTQYLSKEQTRILRERIVENPSNWLAVREVSIAGLPWPSNGALGKYEISFAGGVLWSDQPRSEPHAWVYPIGVARANPPFEGPTHITKVSSQSCSKVTQGSDQ